MLKKFSLRIILNANPLGRKKVEKGDYCNRGNENGVDLNRNWGFHWGKKISLEEEHPGKNEFSEVETTFIRDSIVNFKPLLFVSIHSGIYGLFHPFAFNAANRGKYIISIIDTDPKMKALIEILNDVKNSYCPICYVGTPYKLLKYDSSGTCMDYAYDKLKIPISYAWEIYTNEKKYPQMEKYIKEKSGNVENKNSQLPKTEKNEKVSKTTKATKESKETKAININKNSTTSKNSTKSRRLRRSFLEVNSESESQALANLELELKYEPFGVYYFFTISLLIILELGDLSLDTLFNKPLLKKKT